MKAIHHLILGVFLMLQSNLCIAREHSKCYENLSQVLRCFIDHQDNTYSYSLTAETTHVKSYLLNSQKWPIDDNYQDVPSTTWLHKMYIYLPQKIIHKQALLFVAGGFNLDANGVQQFKSSKEYLDYQTIANNNQAPVVVLEDVPNQFLQINNMPKKEDQIMAYLLKKVAENPFEYAYLSPHLPMAKAVIKAMDATSEILALDNIEINNFTLVGASKRGWAIWLASLADKRVSAIIPIVINVWDVQKNIMHICKSLTQCPYALKDYQQEGVLDIISADNITQLMQIEDPYNYLNLTSYNNDIAKYLINAAGDNFYAPDSAKFYFHQLHGQNYLRYLPQAMHYMQGNPISDYLGNNKVLNQAVDNYWHFHLNNIALPEVSWHFSEDKVQIHSSHVPKKAILWHSHNNEMRDFRFMVHYNEDNSWLNKSLNTINSYLKVSQVAFANFFHVKVELCDNCYYEQILYDLCKNTQGQQCDIEVPLAHSSKGWDANFVELFYDIAGKEFVITTEINVTPETYP
jgi:PhoPQ-activated pathogenicity-related protein